MSSYIALAIGICAILIAWLIKRLVTPSQDNYVSSSITSFLAIAGLMLAVAGGLGAAANAHTSETLEQLHATDVAVARLHGR